ncbi:hypothetical protein COEREDRAFT_85075 [Coemansia reversa NRRL 1564]|uniref:Uncharacterized protein n=1 Tax=Coemansia reversa (strain ATCC 12441 / NRRL 1564) TaxID=763665 RepID=A0A2G5BHU9_COERN|nr:hypothetical protein COEREDRAFT_85075 [Coemansia reversa NRRL 1564]|eukprot:PIA18598.1 hypothetical protein COEREDRAFT_85075 [Coemansia reversa NRRL 1564]
MFTHRPTSPKEADRQIYSNIAAAENGLSIDTRHDQYYGDENIPVTAPHRLTSADERYKLNGLGNRPTSPREQASVEQVRTATYRNVSNTSGSQGARGSPDMYLDRYAGMQLRGSGFQSGQVELNPVTARGIVAGSGGQARADTYAGSTGYNDRGDRQHGQQQLAEGALSPRRVATRQELYGTPSTAHRATISTVLGSGPHSAEVARAAGGDIADRSRAQSTPRAGRRRSAVASPAGLQHSRSEFDTFDGRSVATTFGLDLQLSRPNFDDSSMYAHTPGRDAHQAAMYAMGQTRASMSASAGLRSAANNMLTPETPSGAAFGSRAHRHSRVNSVVSPNTRARALQDTHNALTGGGRAGRAAALSYNAEDRLGQRMQSAQTWYGPGAGRARDTVSDTYAWGPSASGRGRAGSVAHANSSFQYDAQPRGNGLAVGAGAHAHRASFTGSGIGSHTPSGLGSSQARGGARQSGGVRAGDAGSSFMSASGRKARAATQRTGKTPIRSNWYHKEEMLSDGDLKDQEFESSDEEDFDSEERGYGGDMVAQQKLIQKQQRSIFDLNMRCKMLTTAMGTKTGEPYTALLDDFGRTCAANRRANRELDRLRSEVAGFRDECARLVDATANPSQCTLPHGMSEADQQQLDDARRALAVESSMATQRMRMLEDKDAHIRELQEELTRERLNSDHWHRVAMDLRVEADANTSPASATSRARAETATTSETVTLRAFSENSAGADQQRISAQNAQLQLQLRESQQECRELQDELKQTRKKMRDFEEQRRVLQLEMKRSLASRLALGGKSDQVDIARLTEENETLKDECDAMQRQLEDARAQARSHAEAALAAVSSIDLNDNANDDAVAGSAALRAETAKLKIECRDAQKQAELAEENVRQLQEELDTTRDRLHRLCHDYLRPHLRELTVAPTQAEAVYDNVRRWSQFKIAVPAEETGTPTKSNGYISNRFDYNARNPLPSLLEQADSTNDFAAQVPRDLSGSGSPPSF